jgi:hypothetical protein
MYAILAWFIHLDFKVLLRGKPGGMTNVQFTEIKGYRWYAQK